MKLVSFSCFPYTLSLVVQKSVKSILPPFRDTIHHKANTHHSTKVFAEIKKKSKIINNSKKEKTIESPTRRNFYHHHVHHKKQCTFARIFISRLWN